MPELVGYCDLAVGNEEDADKVFGIKALETDVTAGRVDADKYHYVCEELAHRFPNLKRVAITLRGSISASRNTWSAVLWDNGELFTGPSFDITHIVDRVGGRLVCRRSDLWPAYLRRWSGGARLCHCRLLSETFDLW